MTEYIYEYKGRGMVKREEIIRCCDCKHHDKGICSELEQGNGKVLYVNDHDFCAWADKKKVY